MSVCLVTGGAGFIGSHLVEALVRRGDTVRVLDDFSTGQRQNLAAVAGDIELIEGSIEDEARVQQAAAGVELVFHLAAMVSVPQSMAQPRRAEQLNALGTLNVLTAAQKSGARRLVLSSTCAVYGDEPSMPKTEQSPLRPKSPYAVSKLTAEQYCQLFNESFGLPTAVLRYFNVFGPRQDPSSAYSGVISIFVDKLAQGATPKIFGDGEQTRDFVFVSDVVQANLAAAGTPAAAGQVFNIGTGRPVSINRLFASLAQLLGGPGTPDYQPPRPGDIVHSYADPSLAARVLGWSARVEFEAGLRQTIGAA
ncbi:MAG: UDP-N-acetylglucosamine 4-epimerase [Anaerolineae bacterium]|nr:UDP-N-acetylglucosamine 4-epimerase [Anaerolineae bacterium]